MKTLRAIALLTAMAVASQAETFNQGNTAYMSPDGRWINAIITINPGSIEVRARETDSIVGQFDSAATVQYFADARVHRIAEGTGVLIGGSAGVGAAYWLNKRAEESGKIKKGSAGDTVKWGMIAVAGATAISMLLKKDAPYAEVRDGIRVMRLRAWETDRDRFQMALDMSGMIVQVEAEQ